MRFAERSAFGDESSPYGRALEAARTRGGLLDLTLSNPTRASFAYPTEALLQPLQDPAILQYAADPMGLRSAREAVANLYRPTDLSPDQILLTASTSEAYSFLLRLFCNPGDAILVPSPSYPLFDLLARLHDVELIPYPLVYHDGWQIDPSSLTAAITDRTRAIVAIHPNNPTGHFCSNADQSVLYAIAKQHGPPLIVDEVFLQYPVETNSPESFASENSPVLTFVMGGLSKLLALPQMKLAWTVVCGPEPERTEALTRMEVIADTFLSVSAPPQVALPTWLKLGEQIRPQIRERVQHNLATLDAAIAGTAVSRLRVEGGWTAILRVPANDSDIGLAIRLIEKHGVAVHPGSLYGFPNAGRLVISLLPTPHNFADGIHRIMQLL